MISSEDCYLLGTLVKTHGVSGELVLALNNLLAEEVPEMESMFVEFDGLLVPFFIEKMLPRNNTSLLVKFDNLTSCEQAGDFVKCPVFVHRSVVGVVPDEDDLWLRSLEGYRVVDKKEGVVGIIKAYIDLPKNPLFYIKNKKSEIYLPVNEEFIEKIDHQAKTIFIRAPEGLIELYEA